jgi:hypothetical protein
MADSKEKDHILMVDWNQSLAQIIALVVGSGLIVDSVIALSTYIQTPFGYFYR